MSGFEVYALDSPQAARTIRAKLERRKVVLSGFILSGDVTDWPDYRRRVGVLEGIDEALRVCDDLEKEGEARR
jgi:hypothetical protein